MQKALAAGERMIELLDIAPAIEDAPHVWAGEIQDEMGLTNAAMNKEVLEMIGKRFGIFSLLICLASLISLGCGSDEDSDDSQIEAVQAELNRNRRQWDLSGLTNYQYAFQWMCFCIPEFVEPVRVSVRDGAIKAVTYSKSGLPVDGANLTRYHTVEGLFDFIQDAIDRKAHQISVTYDPEFGYPLRASIDYDEWIIDEEMTFMADTLVATE